MQDVSRQIDEKPVMALVASDDASLGHHIRELLIRNALECPSQCVVPLELAADRCSRVSAALTVLVLGPDLARGMEALREVARTVRTQILVIGPAGDPKLILQSQHAGGDEYLDQERLVDELSEAAVRFKARVEQQQTHGPTPCRVISVLGPSGGSGSSTVAVNVATALALEHQAVGLVDLRLGAGDLAALLDLQPVYTLGDLCENLARLDYTMLDQLFVRHSSGVRLLSAPRDFSQIGKVSSKGVRQAVALARGQFPYIVMDVDNAYGEEQLEALWQSDSILFVIRLDYTSIRNTRRVLAHLRAVGVGTDRVDLVVNRYGQSRELRIAQAEEALGMKIAHCIPDDPARVNGSVNSGVPVVLSKAAARVSRSLGELAHSVNGCHL